MPFRKGRLFLSDVDEETSIILLPPEETFFFNKYGYEQRPSNTNWYPPS